MIAKLLGTHILCGLCRLFIWSRLGDMELETASMPPPPLPKKAPVDFRGHQGSDILEQKISGRRTPPSVHFFGVHVTIHEGPKGTPAGNQRLRRNHQARPKAPPVGTQVPPDGSRGPSKTPKDRHFGEKISGRRVPPSVHLFCVQ